jgi:outer membrane protein TolC
MALNHRADIKLARLLVEAAKEDERIMVAAYYPVVNGLFQGEYIPVSGIRRQATGTVHRSDDFVSSEIREGAAYTWRVIDNGKVTGQVRQRRAAREMNEILLKRMEDDVPRDLARIESTLNAIDKKYASLSQATTSAETTVATVGQNLSGGVASQLESRLAENASLDVRTGLLSLIYQQKLALAELDRVTGRYFQYSDEPQPNHQNPRP